MELVTIATLFNAADAQLIRARLEVSGFHPFVQDEIAGTVFEGYIMGAGGIRVQVPDSEAAEAREFLKSASE